MPPALKPLCGVGVAYHHLTGVHSIFRRAGRGPGLKLWGTEPAIPLWYRFISRGKGRSERRLKSQEREGSQHQEGWCTPAARNKMRVLTWDLGIAGLCQSRASARLRANGHTSSATLVLFHPSQFLPSFSLQ